MSIDDKLDTQGEIIRLSHLHPEKSATAVALEYLGIFNHYHADAKSILGYLEQKYTGGSYNNFVAWYASQSCTTSIDRSVAHDQRTTPLVHPRSFAPWSGLKSQPRGGWCNGTR